MKTSRPYARASRAARVRPSTDALERFARATRTRLRTVFEAHASRQAIRRIGFELALRPQAECRDRPRRRRPARIRCGLPTPSIQSELALPRPRDPARGVSHSDLRATNGSRRVARRAGRYAASAATGMVAGASPTGLWRSWDSRGEGSLTSVPSPPRPAGVSTVTRGTSPIRVVPYLARHTSPVTYDG